MSGRFKKKNIFVEKLHFMKNDGKDGFNETLKSNSFHSVFRNVFRIRIHSVKTKKVRGKGVKNSPPRDSTDVFR